MYKILIVDDEELVRKAIISKINWEEIGFGIVKEAEDGEQALEIALELRPHVILTDIRMPFMDGLELSERIHKELPKTKIIILSGHDEFEYAKEAIKIGVTDYILKPIHSVKLTEILRELKSILDSDESSIARNIVVNSQLQQSLPLLKENFFYSLIHNLLTKNEIEEKLKLLEISFTSDSFLICVSEIDNFNNIFQNVKNEHISIINCSIINIMKDILREHGIVFNDADRRQIILIPVQSTNDVYNEDAFKCLLEIIRTYVTSSLNVTITIGKGSVISCLSDIHISYTDALHALSCKTNQGKNKVYDIKDINSIISDHYFPLEKINSLISSIKLDNLNGALILIDDFFDVTITKSNLSVSNIKILLVLLVNNIQKIIIDIDESMDFDLNLNIYEDINKLETVKDFKNVISEFVIKFINLITDSKMNKNDNVVQKSKKYIDEHFDVENLFLTQVASFVSVSAGYLSILFRKETNETFVEYLTSVRMEKAKELLKTSPLKAYEVAYKVGYSDPHYFSLCFKKYTGFTPSSYKNNK